MITVNCLLNDVYIAAAVRPTIAAASRQTVRASAYVVYNIAIRTNTNYLNSIYTSIVSVVSPPRLKVHVRYFLK